jgi:hypothetical protein
MVAKRDTNPNVASDSDVDPKAVEALEQAVARLSAFVDPDGLAPNTVIDITGIAKEKAAAAGLIWEDDGDRELAVKAVQRVLKERCVHEMTRLDRVVLDLANEAGSLFWASTTHPAIVFCSLKSGDTAIRRHSPNPSHSVRAIAVYFDPNLVEAVPVIEKNSGQQRINRETGELLVKPNVYDESGYLAVVGVYGSIADAEQARNQLRRDVMTIQRPIDFTAMNLEGEDAFASPLQALNTL